MQPLLKITNLSFIAGSNAPPVTVSCAVDSGSALIIKGPSGAGKSTLLRTLCRFHRPRSGTVHLLGRPWDKYTVFRWRRLVHYLPQKPVVFEGTVWDNLSVPFSVSLAQKEVTFNAAEAQQLLHLLLPKTDREQNAQTMSGGEQARLALARSMLLKPHVLMLDEPAAALDRDTSGQVMQILAGWLKEEENRGIIMVSHGDDAARLSELGTPVYLFDI